MIQVLFLLGASCARSGTDIDLLGERPTKRAENSTKTSTPDPHDEEPKLPDGPHFVVASGTFDEGDWGDYQAKDWRYVAWGDKDTSCSRFEVGELKGQFGFSCTHWMQRDPAERGGHILARTYDPGGGSVKSVTFGEVTSLVKEVEFRLTTGDVVRVETMAPPEGLNVWVRYYYAFLPFSGNGEIVALGENQQVLESTDLCPTHCGQTGGHR